MPSQGRIAGHLRLLGILWIALSAFRLLPGLALIALFRSGFPFPGGESVPTFVAPLVTCIGMFLLASGIVGILVGTGLLQRQPWARMAALILGGFNLMDMPLGTALGIYTFWVLLPAESEKQYRQMMEGAPSVSRA